MGGDGKNGCMCKTGDEVRTLNLCQLLLPMLDGRTKEVWAVWLRFLFLTYEDMPPPFGEVETRVFLFGIWDVTLSSTDRV
jgi:hypothetical protein